MRRLERVVDALVVGLGEPVDAHSAVERARGVRRVAERGAVLRATEATEGDGLRESVRAEGAIGTTGVADDREQAVAEGEVGAGH